MISIDVPAAPGSTRHPSRLRRLTWVTWRQQRAGLAGFAVVSVVFAAVMLAAGGLGHAQYTTLVRDHCPGPHPLHRCASLGNPFPWLGNTYYPAGVTLAAWIVPVLAGMFLGAPLLAREYERGTARFAWTQGTSRTRWALASLLTLAVPVVAAAAGLGALAEWSLQPFEALAAASRWKDPFEATPLTLAAWALFALLLGVVAGAALRRVVPAMAVAGGASAAVILVNAWNLHDLLLTVGAIVARTRLVPYQSYSPRSTNDLPFFFNSSAARVPAGGWVVDGWFRDRSGHRLSGIALGQVYRAKSPEAWVASHDASAWIRYQPGGHYWALQGLESGALLVLSLVLAASTLFLVRRSST